MDFKRRTDARLVVTIPPFDLAVVVYFGQRSHVESIDLGPGQPGRPTGRVGYFL